MPFINKTRLTLNYLIKEGYPLLIVFNKEGRRRASILVNSYFLNVKKTKRKTILFIIVLKLLSITEN
jgi:hypothetical protein